MRKLTLKAGTATLGVVRSPKDSLEFVRAARVQGFDEDEGLENQLPSRHRRRAPTRWGFHASVVSGKLPYGPGCLAVLHSICEALRFSQS